MVGGGYPYQLHTRKNHFRKAKLDIPALAGTFVALPNTTWNRTMTKKPLGPAYSSMMPAANDQYHAVVSVNTHGEILHAQAVAQVFLNSGEATSQAQAVQMAAAEMAHTIRITRGEQVNRQARQLLDAEAQSTKHHGLAHFGSARAEVAF